MLTGGFACNYWGPPRLTHDADFIAEVLPTHVEKLVERLEDAYYVDADMMRDAIARRDHFNLLHYASGFKIDFWLVKADDLSRARFARRIPDTLFGCPVAFISAEDLILIKLDWFRMSDSERHFVDALNVYKMQGERLDTSHLQ
jgi:hypothetical protein